MTKITMYDGAATIGGNKIYVEEKNKGVFLDFGMNFAKYKVFYQEFLSDRSARGIYDLISLNLIPKLNIYRNDLIPSDLDITSFPKLNVEAILLSHAHLDHFGNMGLLDPKYPIVASPSTIILLKAILDTSYARLGSEVAYFTQKSLYKKDGRVIKTDRQEKSNIGRNFISTAKYSNIFKEFLSTSMKKYKEIQPGNLCTLDGATLPFKVKPYIIDHSIYGATAYILEGDSTVAYTGDFRLHGKKAENSKNFVNNAKNSSILIIEGTRTSREDIDESEDIVFSKCLEAVKDSTGLVIADFSARNFERLENFQEIATAVGRTLVIPNKDAYLLKALEKADGIDRTKDTLIYKEIRGSMKYWEEQHLKELGEKKYIDPIQISNAPDKYLLCFSLFDMKHLLDIKPNGGTYVYSSSEAFEEESEFDFLRLTKWIETFGFKIYGYRIMEQDGREKPEFVKGYHASGHVSQNDIRWAIETIDPDVIIPVHTENPEWFSENFDNALILQDGQSYEI